MTGIARLADYCKLHLNSPCCLWVIRQTVGLVLQIQHRHTVVFLDKKITGIARQADCCKLHLNSPYCS